MTNKIPQEIEEDLTLREIGIGGEGYNDGFKAGQKQSEDAIKEMIEELDDFRRTDKGELFDFKQRMHRKIKQLLSKIGDNSDNSQQRSYNELSNTPKRCGDCAVTLTDYDGKNSADGSPKIGEEKQNGIKIYRKEKGVNYNE